MEIDGFFEECEASDDAACATLKSLNRRPASGESGHSIRNAYAALKSLLESLENMATQSEARVFNVASMGSSPTNHTSRSITSCSPIWKATVSNLQEAIYSQSHREQFA